MNVCAVPFSESVDELAEAGLTHRPGAMIAAPSIAESPAALECRLHSFLDIGNSREIAIGEVVFVHLRKDMANDSLNIDPVVLDAVGRMGGHGYATSRDYFDLKTMSENDYLARSDAGRQVRAAMRDDPVGST